jgi:hypothetical protein
MKEPVTVLSDHHYAESSPNLQGPNTNRLSSYTASLAETAETNETVEAEEQGNNKAFNRVIFLVCPIYSHFWRRVGYSLYII